MRSLFTLFPFAVLIPACAMSDHKADSATRTEVLELHIRMRVQDRVVEEVVRWSPQQTAVVICDMWDSHWCKSAARRVAEMAVPMNRVVEAARRRGLLIIHAPSTAVTPYVGTPARRRAMDAPFAAAPVPLSTKTRWGTTWCWLDPEHESKLPIDDSDMGCDCATKCTIRDAWTRQIDTIRIHDADAVTDDGQEVYNLLKARGIENVILMGVHLNMCVLGRPFGIRQMVNLGKNVVLVRDLTDTMYDPRQPPKVDHFTGTDLVVAHVERHWCPSITSVDLAGGKAFHFEADRRH